MMVYFSLAQERWNAFVYFETFLSLLQIFADVQKHHFFFLKNLPNIFLKIELSHQGENSFTEL